MLNFIKDFIINRQHDKVALIQKAIIELRGSYDWRTRVQEEAFEAGAYYAKHGKLKLVKSINYDRLNEIEKSLPDCTRDAAVNTYLPELINELKRIMSSEQSAAYYATKLRILEKKHTELILNAKSLEIKYDRVARDNDILRSKSA
jgi:hypothetical protein